MATVKEITHDSSTVIGDFYSSVTDLDGAITVDPVAALNGSVNGIDFDLDAGANVIFLRETFAALATNELSFRIYVDISNATPAGANILLDWRIENSAGSSPFRLRITGDGSGNFRTWLAVADDTGTTLLGFPTILPNQATCIEVSAIRETADGNADGIVNFYVNGALVDSATNIDNFNLWVADGGMQAVDFDIGVLSTGNFYYDEFIFDNDASVDLGCRTLVQNKPASINASGEFIYIALFSGGTPILTKISTALDADGVTVFDPGTGSRIGVECGRFSSDTVWVAGNFDGTNVVEKSEDGGTTFTVKDDGTMGSVRTFVMGPDSDERILVFDETNGDILETIDDGASWTTINAAVTPEVNAIARFGKNVQECVFGNDGAANNSINYSVNSGGNLADYQTGVYPNANATRVIVN